MQRINNVFDHPLSVADAATINWLTFSQRPGFASITWTRRRRGAMERKERRKYTCRNLCLACSQVSLSDDRVCMFLWVTSLLQAGTHTLLALLLMHLQPNLSLETKTHTLGSEFLQAFIYPTTPIDLEEFISMVTRAHKFSFAPPGQGYCCYHSMDDWTLA